MKRILFYALLLIQIVVVLVIVIQYHLIDTYGIDRTFNVYQYDEDDDFYYSEPIKNYNSYAFDLEINQIPIEKWKGKKDVYYRDIVYVLIGENKSGDYEVIRATDKKIESSNDNEFVLLGKNIYKEDQTYHVNYDFEEINVATHEALIKNKKNTEIKKVTYRFAPWKQSKLINIE